MELMRRIRNAVLKSFSDQELQQELSDRQRKKGTPPVVELKKTRKVHFDDVPETRGRIPH
jgi:hypothetical protein